SLPETDLAYEPENNRAQIRDGQIGEGQIRQGTPLLLLFLTAAFLLCCLLLYRLLKSPMSGMRLSDGPRDRHALVAGMALDALRRPAAWREVPGIWRRAILPTMNAGRISLARLLDMAELGQAFTASPGNELLAAARGRGAVVLDPEVPYFGRVYRAMSGMRSMDAMLAWCPSSTGAAEARLLEEITSLLKRAGLATVCRAVRPGETSQVFRWMDLAPLRPVDESIWPRHFVAVVVEHPWWCDLLERFGRLPHWALLAASDRLAAEAGLDATVAQNLRRKAAEQAIAVGLRSEERTQP
ncbi:MAG: hypothetical protein JRF33_18050, partial [Deltaproteobacteria bacterium]|nr:hypothetical protein [Deltaproteobacteria bacterium]